MYSKAHVISEIQKMAGEIGKPPGQKLFEKQTGISKSYWNGKYWPRWSAALEDAGLTPNVRNPKIPTTVLLDQYLELLEELGSIPTVSELRMRANADAGFPAAATIVRQLGDQRELLLKAAERAREIKASDLVVEIIGARLSELCKEDSEASKGLTVGTVYLLQSGQHFKIGRSTDLERRVKEIGVSLPQKLELVHSIQTDDTVGIELYWHRRFSEKRLSGEWFALNTDDVRAFKRRRFQ